MITRMMLILLPSMSASLYQVLRTNTPGLDKVSEVTVLTTGINSHKSAKSVAARYLSEGNNADFFSYDSHLLFGEEPVLL